MILATERHAVPDGLPAALAADVAVFLDMDMAILGAAPAAYDGYAAGVAREFVPFVGAAAYRRGRGGLPPGGPPAVSPPAATPVPSGARAMAATPETMA